MSGKFWAAAYGQRKGWNFVRLADMFGSIRPFVLLLMAVILTVSACATGAQKKPLYFDSDTAGKKAKPAEFSSCTPRTETGPILLDGNLPKYPRREQMSGTIGSVAVRFVVTEAGRAINIETLRVTSRRFSTAANNRFAGEVETAVGNWTFQPAIDQGMPAAVVCAQKHLFGDDGSGAVSVILLPTSPAAEVDQN